VQGHQWWS